MVKMRRFGQIEWFELYSMLFKDGVEEMMKSVYFVS